MISLRFFRKNKVILVHIFLTFELTFPGCFLQYFQPALRRQTGHNRLIFDTNHGLFSDCFQEKSRGLHPITVIAPSLMLSLLSGIIRSSSNSILYPSPKHSGHAPNGLLKEKLRGSISSILIPQSGQEKL